LVCLTDGHCLHPVSETARAGVPEQVIMRICRWKTRSVFDRYRIVPEAYLREGHARLAERQPTDGERARVS
jgi:hypothetical protein